MVVFLSGVDEPQLLAVFGYQKRRLSLRYLVVPLISTKLSLANCMVLIDCVMAELEVGIVSPSPTWVNYSLSNQSSSSSRFIGPLFLSFPK